MPTATQNVYSIFVLPAPLNLNNLWPTCQNVARRLPIGTPHFAPQLGKFFPITEMHKCTQNGTALKAAAPLFSPQTLHRICHPRPRRQSRNSHPRNARNTGAGKPKYPPLKPDAKIKASPRYELPWRQSHPLSTSEQAPSGISYLLDMQQQQPTGRPRIRIWASDAYEDLYDYQIMKDLASHMDFLDELLFENGIMEADFTPNLDLGSGEPDSDIHVRLHSSPDTPYITDPLRQVRSGIFDRANLEISLHRALDDRRREILQQKQLAVTWTN
jgi:hypothetical protein